MNQTEYDKGWNDGYSEGMKDGIRDYWKKSRIKNYKKNPLLKELVKQRNKKFYYTNRENILESKRIKYQIRKRYHKNYDN